MREVGPAGEARVEDREEVPWRQKGSFDTSLSQSPYGLECIHKHIIDAMEGS